MAGLVDKMAEYMNAMAAAKTKADQDAIALDMSDSLREIVVMLSDMNKVHVEASDATIAESAGVATLVDTTKQMLETGEKEAETMASLESLQATTEAKKLAADKSGGIIAQIKQTGAILKDMAKLSAKEYIQNTKVGKLWQSVSKEMKKQGASKTKVVEGKADDKGGGGGELPAPELNSGLIASEMAGAAAKALNPFSLVMAFLTKVLPLIIIFGLLLYGFIKGYLDGDVMDFLLVIGGVVLAAFIGYVAWCLIKEGILLAFKFVCEVIKTMASVAADWAGYALIAVAIGIIVVAFIVVAAIIAVAVVLAVLGIVIAMYILTKAMKAMMTDMIEDIMGVFEEQLGKTEDMIKLTMQTLSEVIPMMAQKMLEMSDTLNKGLTQVIGRLETSFLMMQATMDKLAAEISRIFNGLVAAILGSYLNKQIEKTQEQPKLTQDELKDLVVNTMTVSMEMDKIFTALLLGQMVDAFMDAITPITENMAAIGQNFADVIFSLLDTIEDLYTGVSSLIIKQTIKLIGAVIDSVEDITSAFLGILFGMPIVGWLMGLVGANSFSKAIEPLVENTRQIKDLENELLMAALTKHEGYARSSAINNTVTNSETQVIDAAEGNYFTPVDGESVEADTNTLSSTPSNFVTSQAFAAQMALLRTSIKDVTDAVYKTAPEKTKSGLFGLGWF